MHCRKWSSLSCKTDVPSGLEQVNSRVSERELITSVVHIHHDEILWTNTNRIVNERALVVIELHE